MKITEKQLRKIIRESLIKLAEQSDIEEGFLGLSADNFIRNGHFRENLHTKNPVINTAWRYGWELSKPDNEIEGDYEATIMSGVFNDVRPDNNADIENVKHPKASWPMLIAMLNKELRPQGYVVSGSNYRQAFVNLSGEESNNPYDGTASYRGTITVRKA